MYYYLSKTNIKACTKNDSFLTQQNCTINISIDHSIALSSIIIKNPQYVYIIFGSIAIEMKSNIGYKPQGKQSQGNVDRPPGWGGVNQVSEAPQTSRLPCLHPCTRQTQCNNKTTAPACVQSKNIKPIFLLGPSPQSATKKKPGINMTSKKT